MTDIISGPLGLVHFSSAVLSLLFGTLILVLPKGTQTHRLFGAIYVVCMFVLNGTAFGLYNLFGRFGAFHVAAVISLVTVLAGLIPVLRKKPDPTWIVNHLSWMYWSVIGLYAAFVAEMLTRIPGSSFFGTVALASGATIVVGGFFYSRLIKKWARAFVNSPPSDPIRETKRV